MRVGNADKALGNRELNEETRRRHRGSVPLGLWCVSLESTLAAEFAAMP